MTPAQKQFSLNRAAAKKQILINQILINIMLLGLFVPPVSGGVENPDRAFRLHGKPIHPLLVKQFEPWVSDERPPITVEVNVTAARDSNQYASEFKTDANGVVSVRLPEGGSYAYRHLGMLRDQIHVLRTFDSGGGSGVFQAVLFVRFRTGTAYLADGVTQDRQVFMQVIRRYPLGDRDEAEVAVQPDHVTVGKSRHRAEPVVLRFGDFNPSGAFKSNQRQAVP